jgi:hypothetical protein
LSISTIRASIRSKLESIVRIDDWDLDWPKNRDLKVVYQGDTYFLPANVAHYDPIVDLNYRRGQITAELDAIFKYFITYRFDAKLSKDQLPIDQLEDLQQYLITTFVLQFNCVDQSIKQVEVAREEYPVRITRINGEDGDWCVTIVIPLLISFWSYPKTTIPAIQPGDLNGEETPPWQWNFLNLGIYKRSIDKTQTNLDRTFVLEIEHDNP